MRFASRQKSNSMAILNHFPYRSCRVGWNNTFNKLISIVIEDALRLVALLIKSLVFARESGNPTNFRNKMQILKQKNFHNLLN